MWPVKDLSSFQSAASVQQQLVPEPTERLVTLRHTVLIERLQLSLVSFPQTFPLKFNLLC